MPSVGSLHDIQEQLLWCERVWCLSFGNYLYANYNIVVNNCYRAQPHNISDIDIDCYARIVLMDFALQFLAVAMLVKITQKTTMNGCHICLIRICSCNCLSLCSSCTLNPHHIWTNKLLCHVQAISGKWSNLWTGVLCNISSRTRFNFTCCIQTNSHRVWFLEPILLPPSHSSHFVWANYKESKTSANTA